MSDTVTAPPEPSDLTALEARERALTYRLMARKIPDMERRDALIRLAERFEWLAEQLM